MGYELTRELTVPSLSELRISRDEFLGAAPLMAQQAIASGSPSNNPVTRKPPSASGYANRCTHEA